MDTGRTLDIMELYRALDRETSPHKRDQIRHSIKMIKNETGAIRSMREALMRAHRNGDVEEVRDIHDFIKNKAKYSNN